MKYDILINAIQGNDRDWEIVMEDIDKLYDATYPRRQSPKLRIYVGLLKKKHIFPPISVDENNQVIDGTHRLLAHEEMKRKRVPIIRAVGKGTGRVLKDEVYKNVKMSLPAEDEPQACFGCKNNLTYFRKNESPPSMSEFSNGLPKPPIYVCRKCRIIINRRTFIKWHSFQY